MLSISLKKLNISAVEVAWTEIFRLDEVIRKGEIFIHVQLENLRAIDGRAMRLMTSTGLLLSIIFGMIKFIHTSIASAWFNGIILCATLCGIASILSCLLIIQSEKVSPPGNDPLILLKDISDGYSVHEEKVDYITVLSGSQRRNEELIKRNGSFLKFSSRAFFVMLICIVFAGLKII